MEGDKHNAPGWLLFLHMTFLLIVYFHITAQETTSLPDKPIGLFAWPNVFVCRSAGYLNEDFDWSRQRRDPSVCGVDCEPVRIFALAVQNTSSVNHPC